MYMSLQFSFEDELIPIPIDLLNSLADSTAEGFTEQDDIAINQKNINTYLKGGDDTIEIIGGINLVDSGKGNDIYFVKNCLNSIYLGRSGYDVWFVDKSLNSTYLGGKGNDIFNVNGGSSNFYNGETGKDVLKLFSGQGEFLGGNDNDIFEVFNAIENSLVNGNKGEDFITGIASIIYRGGKGDDRIVVSQGEIYGDQGVDTFVGVKGDGYAVIQDFTIKEDRIEIDLDGVWDQIYGGSMFTDNSGEQIMFLSGIGIEGPVSPLGTRPEDMRYT